MYGVAVLLPVTVAIGRPAGLDLPSLLAYVLFALLGVGVLGFREAVQRRLRAPAQHQQRFTVFALVEALGLFLIVGALVVLEGQLWGVAIIVIPAVLMDVAIRRRGMPIPLWDELTGILSISLAVPVGSVILELGGYDMIALLYGIFVAFHVLGLVRVKTALSRDSARYRTVLGVGLGIHLVFLVAAGAGWWVGATGVSTPLVFLASLGRGAWLAAQDEPPAVRRLGRGERAFSVILLLGGPLLLP